MPDDALRSHGAQRVRTASGSRRRLLRTAGISRPVARAEAQARESLHSVETEPANGGAGARHVGVALALRGLTVDPLTLTVRCDQVAVHRWIVPRTAR